MLCGVLWLCFCAVWLGTALTACLCCLCCCVRFGLECDTVDGFQSFLERMGNARSRRPDSPEKLLIRALKVGELLHSVCQLSCGALRLWWRHVWGMAGPGRVEQVVK